MAPCAMLRVPHDAMIAAAIFHAAADALIFADYRRRR